MSDKQEKNPLDELKGLFEAASEKAHEAWTEARKYSEAASRENEIYRELVTFSSAAYDALERALRMAWTSSKSK